MHVQLAHLSIQTSLTPEEIQMGKVKHFSFSAQSVHTLISWTCLFVALGALLLQLDNLDGWESITDLNSPLAIYIHEYWIQHAVSKDVLSSSELECQMRSLVQSQSTQYINWI